MRSFHAYVMKRYRMTGEKGRKASYDNVCIHKKV